MWFWGLLALVGSSVAFAEGSATSAAPDWKKIGDEEGVEYFSKEIPGTNIIAFRGVTLMDASASKISAVLLDSPRKKEWVDRVVEAYTIKHLNEWETLEYNHTKGVFIVSDRDFVFKARVAFDVPAKRVSFHLRSTEAAEMPDRQKADGIVRGILADSHYVLTEIAPGKTRVEVDILADPKGAVPVFVANLFQKSWPKRTLNGIRKETQRPELEDNPKYRAILDGKIKDGFPRETVQ